MRWWQRFSLFVINILLVSLLTPVSFAQNTALEYQRLHFQRASAALKAKDYATFQTLVPELQSYPLYGYLGAQYYDAVFKQVSSEELLDFIRNYGNSAMGEPLRQKLLSYFSTTQQWEAFLQAMQGYVIADSQVALRCQHLNAQQAVYGNSSELDDELMNLWMVGKPRPAACDLVFESLFKRGIITEDLIWQRIQLAMDVGEIDLAKTLARRLSNTEAQTWLTLWETMSKRPLDTLQNFNVQDAEQSRDIVIHGLKKVADSNVNTAQALWEKWQQRYAFNNTQIGDFKYALAVAAYKQNHPDTYNLITAVPSAFVDENLNNLRFNTALKQQDWTAVADFVNELPTDLSKEPRFRYWYARALEELHEVSGSGKTPLTLFKELAKERDYYGFLAADRSNSPYNVEHRPLPHTAAEMAYVTDYLGVRAAKEFLELGMDSLARKEWDYAVKQFDQRQKILAATVAARWQWYDRAILTSAKADYFDDLEMRFPLAYYDDLAKAAETQGIDLAWAYGITRQESIFIKEAKSPAGALGLMQLMPATGRMVAKRIGISVNSNDDILAVENNVQLGTAYLAQLLEQFDGNYMLATAGYNAGPGRAKKWAADFGCLPADMWMELIPFDETRTYVRRVLFYTRMFEERLKQQPQPLRVALAPEYCLMRTSAVIPPTTEATR